MNPIQTTPLAPDAHGFLAVDGNTIRDALGLIVSIVEHENGAPVAVCAAPNKGHELPAAPQLLRSDALHLVGCVVTAEQKLAGATPFCPDRQRPRANRNAGVERGASRAGCVALSRRARCSTPTTQPPARKTGGRHSTRACL